MLEIRLHGRGGQGAVVGCKILAMAVYIEGKYVQAFPSFGVERRGAPVTAFVRIDDHPINIRHQIYHPDHLIVLDATLMKNGEIFEGLKPGGFILINAKHEPKDFSKNPKLKDYRIAVIDANSIAAHHHLGMETSPIVNTAILGAFTKVTEICSIETLCSAIMKGAPVEPKANAAAAREAYEGVKL